ncbi:hypothetical protein AUP68_08129 [Ilyonectria robusta]
MQIMWTLTGELVGARPITLGKNVTPVDQFREVRSLEQLIKSLELERKQIDTARKSHPQPASGSVDYESLVKPEPTPSFFHHPLPSTPGPWIRLVELQPSSSLWAPIECKLRNVRLAENPVYDALSYAWSWKNDYPQPFQPVYIDGRKLTVSHKLAEALVHHRSRDGVRVLWTDEICIPEFSDERDEHVLVRRDIFRGAATTLVWLGPDNGLAQSLHVAEDIIDARDRMRAAGDERIVVDLKPGDFAKLNIPAPWDPCVRTWLALFTRPWFQDLWSIHDVCVSPTVILLVEGGGKDTGSPVSWDLLMRGLHAARDLEYFALCREDTTFARVMELARTQYRDATRRQTRILPLLLAGRHYDVEAMLDKVYCLLGLLEPLQSIQIGHRGWSNPEKVFIDTAIAIMEQDGTLDLLGVPRGRDTRLRTLPTWVPDWTNCSRLIQSLQGLELDSPAEQNGDAIPQFAASGPGSTYTVKLGPENRTLGVSGFIVTNVEAMHTMHPGARDIYSPSPYEGLLRPFSSASLEDFRGSVSKSVQTWEAMRDTANLTTSSSIKQSYVATGESVQEAFRQTMVAGRVGADKDMVQFSDVKTFAGHADIVVRGLRLLRSAGKLTGIRGQKALLSALHISGWNLPGPESSAFFHRLSVMEGRRMMRASDDGMFGIVPQAARVGDKIALLKGARLPIVLRERGSEWAVIGEAYIHGLMNGERWDESKVGDIWLA